MTTLTNTLDKTQQTTQVTNNKSLLVEIVEVFSLWAITATVLLAITISTWA